MKTGLSLAFLALGLPCAYSAEVDPRISTHTYVREDIFAVLDGDLARFAQGEKKIAQLLVERPQDRPALLAWQGGATLFRAASASQAGKQEEFLSLMAKSTAAFDEAIKTARGDQSVWIAMGGSCLL